MAIVSALPTVTGATWTSHGRLMDGAAGDGGLPRKYHYDWRSCFLLSVRYRCVRRWLAGMERCGCSILRAIITEPDLLTTSPTGGVARELSVHLRQVG